MELTDSQYDQLMRQLQEANSGLGQVTTMLRGHITEQRGINRRFEHQIHDLDLRVRSQEGHSERMSERVPAGSMRGPEITDRFVGIEEDVKAVKDSVAENGRQIGRIGLTIARWGGIVAASLVVAELGVSFLIKWFTS